MNFEYWTVFCGDDVQIITNQNTNSFDLIRKVNFD